MINFINGLNVVGDSTFADSITMLDVVNAGTDTNKFLVLSSSGVVNFRTGAELASDIGAGTGTVTGSGTATRVAFWNSSTALSSSANLYWDNGNSRLGVGTSSPSALLDVKTTGNTVAKFQTTATSDLAIEVANSQGSMFFGLGGGEQFGIGTTADLNGTGNLFIIEQGGNTGIGTTSPAEKLEVVGDIKVNDSVNPNIRFARGVSYYWDIGHTSSDFQFKSQTGGTIMHLNYDGNVGVGTTSPSDKLQVNGTVRASGYKSSDGSSGQTSTFTVRNGNNSASLTFVIKNGIVTSVSSDRRLKTNITLIGTSDSGINIYTFEYKYKFSIEGVGLFQGVMSDEVPAEAVSVDTHGFDVVDYSLIDVEFRRVSI